MLWRDRSSNRGRHSWLHGGHGRSLSRHSHWWRSNHRRGNHSHWGHSGLTHNRGHSHRCRHSHGWWHSSGNSKSASYIGSHGGSGSSSSWRDGGAWSSEASNASNIVKESEERVILLKLLLLRFDFCQLFDSFLFWFVEMNFKREALENKLIWRLCRHLSCD